MFYFLVVEVPYLNCPNDFSIKLPSDRSTISLGSDWVEPNTNINLNTSNVLPVGVGMSYEFKAGQTLVSYAVTHESGTLYSCSYVVHVKGKRSNFYVSCQKSCKFYTFYLKNTILLFLNKFFLKKYFV